jgi:hypothetical protein
VTKVRKAKWLADVKGTVTKWTADGEVINDPGGTKRGQIDYFSEAECDRLVKWGYVTTDLTGEIGRPFITPAWGPRG